MVIETDHVNQLPTLYPHVDRPRHSVCEGDLYSYSCRFLRFCAPEH